MLPVDGVTLVTLFLDDGGFCSTDNASCASRRGTALLWYIEVVDDCADVWKSPDTTLRRVSPLFEDGLADLLTDETR